MKKAEISDGDLMGEKLGIVHICANCHKRIYPMDSNVAEIVRSMTSRGLDRVFIEEVYAHLNEKTGEYKFRCKQNDPSMTATPRAVNEL